jgi:protease-4
VTDANGIYLELMNYKKKYNIPVYAYVDGLCASGGMYIALAADKILSSDISLIGSVGVIAPTFMNATSLLEKIGVEALTISAGKGKDSLNPFRPWQPGEDKNYTQIIDYYYKHFVNLVVNARPEISKEKLVNEYGAHIFPADIAQQFGFIDASNKQIGEAIEELMATANLEKDNYQVIQLESKDWWDSLFSAEAPWRTGTIKHQLSLSPSFDLLMQNHYLYMHYPL